MQVGLDKKALPVKLVQKSDVQSDKQMCNAEFVLNYFDRSHCTKPKENGSAPILREDSLKISVSEICKAMRFFLVVAYNGKLHRLFENAKPLVLSQLRPNLRKPQKSAVRFVTKRDHVLLSAEI